MSALHQMAQDEENCFTLRRKTAQDRVVALGGNPNVGKSTVFNALTGLRQHTGNWPGKTVAVAQGRYRYADQDYILVDIPGAYSLMANSAEEEIARDFLCFRQPDVAVIVADATCLERNLNLVLQVMELTEKTVLCVNLMDEARKKKIRINLPALSRELGVPVVGTNARGGEGLQELMAAVDRAAVAAASVPPLRLVYAQDLEQAVALLHPALDSALDGRLNSRWAALRLLEGDESLLASLAQHLDRDLLKDQEVVSHLAEARKLLAGRGVTPEIFRDRVATRLVQACEDIAAKTVRLDDEHCRARSQRIDKILTSRLTGIPIMLLLLAGIFWLTITGANYPSALLAQGLFSLIEPLRDFFQAIFAPAWVTGLLVDGMYKTLAWVVSVMLPPMAIFFPLFTLLEDLGYLPRVAFNLDNCFRRACAHGKQALTMCMGFGCNACGVMGCRIIDSPRERLIAILTNNFVPCNGRFPTLIAIITMFFAAGAAGLLGSILPALLLTGVIVLGVATTFVVSRLLSATILRGVPSSFQLELPPYRRPQIGRVILRSVLDRTLFVLGRAVVVAAPAGLVVWLLANVQAGGASLLGQCAAFLDPFARLMGLDGFILMAFLLGLPANEVVVPILIMSYTAAGSLTDFESLAQLHALFISHGWTWLTALCTLLFSLLHWPCATTLITIQKETSSGKWTLAAFLIPTVIGIALCMAITAAARLLGLV